MRESICSTRQYFTIKRTRKLKFGQLKEDDFSADIEKHLLVNPAIGEKNRIGIGVGVGIGIGIGIGIYVVCVETRNVLVLLTSF